MRDSENEYLVHTYRAEYAKGHAKCKTCYEEIAIGDLRLAKMTKSFRFDGKEYEWHHPNCFFIPNRHLDVPTVPGEVGLVENIDCLRWEDQEKISKRIAEGTERTLLDEFKTEYYKVTYDVDREAKCSCDEGIKQGEIIIWKKEPKVPGMRQSWIRGKDDGTEIVSWPIHGRARGYHLTCFAKNREKLGFLCNGANLPGLLSLSKDDQEKIVSLLPDVEEKVGDDGSDEPDPKRAKFEAEDPVEEALKERRKEQNKEMFYYRDLLGEHCKRKDLYFMMEHNNQEVPSPRGKEEALDRLCDMMTFGALAPCQECHGGPLVYQSGAGYRCHGEIHVKTTRKEEDPRLPMSEFPLWYPPVKLTKKCQVLLVNPRRVKFMVPEKFKKQFDFLKVYKSKIRTRLIPIIPGLPEIQASGVAFESSVVPLQGFDFPKSSKTHFFPIGRESVTKETKAASLVVDGEDIGSADSEGNAKRNEVNECEVIKHADENSSDDNNNDGEKAEEGSSHKFWYKKDARGFRKNAKQYTEEEDLNILKYIEENQMFENVKGRKVWQEIEEKNILEGRTWQSMKERFRKVMMTRIKSYGLIEETVQKFKGLY